MGEVSNALDRLQRAKAERDKGFVPFRRNPYLRTPIAHGRRAAREQVRPASSWPSPATPGHPHLQPIAGKRPAADPDFFSANAPHIAVPRKKEEFWAPRSVALENGAPDAENFRHLAVKVANALAERRANTLLVTSALYGEGKTTIACNLALALASLAAGKPIALVDFDFRKPDLANVMGVSVGSGVETVLHNDAPLRSRRIRTDFHSLDLFLTGKPQQNVHTLFSGPVVAAVIAQLSAKYALTIIDAPPVIPVPDAALLMNHVEASLSITKRGHTRRSAFEEALSLLPEEKNIGTFFNYCAPARHRTRQ